jgi:hypothetical protein
LSEPEAELLVGPAPAATAAIAALTERAKTLRSQVAAVDAVREDLHGLLYARWEQGRQKRRLPPLLRALLRKVRPEEAPLLPAGYDPLVHLFGRSLPVAAPSPRAVADHLREVLVLRGDAYREALMADLRALDGNAGSTRLPDTRSPPELEAAIQSEWQRVVDALAEARAVVAWDALVRLSAWSRPIWRLDGELLGQLLEELGLTVRPDRATVLFEELADERPELQSALELLPSKLLGFTGAGGYLSSTSVKLLAGSLRMSGARLLQNAGRNADDTEVTLRHLRLLSEAVFFCEEEGLGLAEATGVEWHDRDQTNRS